LKLRSALRPSRIRPTDPDATVTSLDDQLSAAFRQLASDGLLGFRLLRERLLLPGDLPATARLWSDSRHARLLFAFVRRLGVDAFRLVDCAALGRGAITLEPPIALDVALRVVSLAPSWRVPIHVGRVGRRSVIWAVSGSPATFIRGHVASE
jgi:hypothetical protein